MKIEIAYDRVVKSLHVYVNGVLTSTRYEAYAEHVSNEMLIALNSVAKSIVTKSESGSCITYTVRSVRTSVNGRMV